MAQLLSEGSEPSCRRVHRSVAVPPFSNPFELSLIARRDRRAAPEKTADWDRRHDLLTSAVIRLGEDGVEDAALIK